MRPPKRFILPAAALLYLIIVFTLHAQVHFRQTTHDYIATPNRSSGPSLPIASLARSPIYVVNLPNGTLALVDICRLIGLTFKLDQNSFLRLSSLNGTAL